MSDVREPHKGGITEELFHTVSGHRQHAAMVERKLADGVWSLPKSEGEEIPEMSRARQIIEEQNRAIQLMSSIIKRQCRSILNATNAVNDVLDERLFMQETAERIRGVKVSLLEGLKMQPGQGRPGVIVQLPGRMERLTLKKKRDDGVEPT